MDWAKSYAEALGFDLTDEEASAILDLARLVAHRTERVNAPLASFLAGRLVQEQAGSGASTAEAIQRAVATAEGLTP